MKPDKDSPLKLGKQVTERSIASVEQLLYFQ